MINKTLILHWPKIPATCTKVYLQYVCILNIYTLHTNLNIQFESFTKSILSPFIPEANRSSNFASPISPQVPCAQLIQFSQPHRWKAMFPCRGTGPAPLCGAPPVLRARKRGPRLQGICGTADVQVCIVEVDEWYVHFAVYKCIYTI